MNDLETRYRSALRWYPRQWRQANEEAVVGTLLDVAEGDHRREPAKRELANLRRNGVAARFGIVDRLVSPLARGYASILALGLGTGISAAGIFFGSLTYQLEGRVYRQVFSLPALLQHLGAGQGVYLLWLVAFTAVMLGLRGLAAVVLLGSIPVSIAWTAVALGLSDYGHPSDVSLGFLGLLAVVTATGLVGPSAQSRKPFISSLLGSGLLLAGAFWLRGYGGGYWGNGARFLDYFWSPFAVWLVFVGIPLALVIALVCRRWGKRDEATGVLLAAAPLLPLALFAFGGEQNGIPTAAEAITMVVVIVALAICVLRAFGLRIRITRV